MTTWWEKWPARLTYELKALDVAGIPWTIDEESQRHGVLRLHLGLKLGSNDVPLVATFPDIYPYFRFELTAPTLSLGHHQNPFLKSLCLLPRRTHFWDTNFTVANLIDERLPLVLRAGKENDREAVRALEQHQGEPFSDYYTCAPNSVIVVQSEWSIDAAHRHGKLVIATDTPDGQRPSKLIRGAVIEILGENDELLAKADDAFRLAFPGRKLEGTWVRAAAPIATDDPVEFLCRIRALNNLALYARPNHVDDGWLQVVGVLFPEEVAWRRDDDGWVFLCALSQKRPDVGRPRLVKHGSSPRQVKGGSVVGKAR